MAEEENDPEYEKIVQQEKQTQWQYKQDDEENRKLNDHKQLDDVLNSLSEISVNDIEVGEPSPTDSNMILNNAMDSVADDIATHLEKLASILELARKSLDEKTKLKQKIACK